MGHSEPVLAQLTMSSTLARTYSPALSSLLLTGTLGAGLEGAGPEGFEAGAGALFCSIPLVDTYLNACWWPHTAQVSNSTQSHSNCRNWEWNINGKIKFLVTTPREARMKCRSIGNTAYCFPQLTSEAIHYTNDLPMHLCTMAPIAITGHKVTTFSQHFVYNLTHIL